MSRHRSFVWFISLLAISVLSTFSPAEAAPQLYWASRAELNRLNTASATTENVLLGLYDPIAFARHPGTGKFFIIDQSTGRILTLNADGTSLQVIVDGLSTPSAIVLDSAAGKIYFASIGTSKIQRANVDGTGVEDVVTGLGTPTALALDASAGKLYWTDSSSDRVQRANLNGSNIETLVEIGVYSILNGIALDLTNNKIYWTDSGSDKIQRSNLDGTSVEDLVSSGLSSPSGIAVHPAGGKIYWTDSYAMKVQRANLNGSSVQDLVSSGLWRPTDILLDSTGNKVYFIDSNRATIHRMNYDGSSRVAAYTAPISSPGYVTFDYDARKIYWTDVALGSICRADFDGSNPEPVITGLNTPAGIAVDAQGGKVYWSDFIDDKIYRANLDGSGSKQTLATVSGTLNPLLDSLAIDTVHNNVYWVDLNNGKIQRTSLSGGAVEDVQTGLQRPEGIGVDAANGKIYWSVQISRKIQRANLDGSGAEDLIVGGATQIPGAFVLDSHAGKIYWDEIVSKKVIRANLSGTGSEDILTGSELDGNENFAILPLYDISGTVILKDLAGNPLPNVELHLGSGSTVFSDSSGHYTFEDVPPGTYVLSAELNGYVIETDEGSPSFSVNVTGDNLVRDFAGAPALQNPLYGLWNGFLGMINVLELVNTSSSTVTVSITMYDISGDAVYEEAVPVDPHMQKDVMLNLLPAFAADSYGILRIGYSGGSIDGRVFYYRSVAGSDDYEFAFGVPLAGPLTNDSYVAFNTYQPSRNPAEQNNQVAQWLALINLDQVEREFTVRKYDQAGTLLNSFITPVPPMSRVDLEAGHEDPGANAVGSIKISAESSGVPYLAQLFRYGSNAPAGQVPISYSFAFPLLAESGSSEQVYAPISVGAGGDNWVEVINVSDAAATVSLDFFDNTGAAQGSVSRTLGAHAQEHFYATALLPAGATGIVRITPSDGPVIAQSMFYFRDPSTQSISSMYGSQARNSYGRIVHGSYNLYLGMYNWLKLINLSDDEAIVALRLVLPSGTETILTRVLPAHGGTDLGLHESPIYGTSPDTYGAFAIQAPSDGAVFSELLRVKPTATGTVDFAAPTVAR